MSVSPEWCHIYTKQSQGMNDYIVECLHESFGDDPLRPVMDCIRAQQL